MINYIARVLIIEIR